MMSECRHANEVPVEHRMCLDCFKVTAYEVGPLIERALREQIAGEIKAAACGLEGSSLEAGYNHASQIARWGTSHD